MAVLRTTEAPKNTGIGYKVFYMKDGKLYPPMVNPDGMDTPIGVWLDAQDGAVWGYSKTGRKQVCKGGKGTHTSKGNLSFRPGYHLGTRPIAEQFRKKDGTYPQDFVWGLCEYSADINYQDECNKNGITKTGKFQHSLAGLTHLPIDGYYKYRTNPNPNTEEWIITGSIKVLKILSKDEVKEILLVKGE